MVDGQRSSNGVKSRIVVIALTIAVVAGAVGAVLWLNPLRASVVEDSREQARALRAADNFAVAINTYDVKDLDEYRERVQNMMTDELGQQFDEINTAVLDDLDAADVVSKGTVRWSAVDTFDADSAVVLASVDQTLEPTSTFNDSPRYRWKIDLVKSEGRWLVDQFVDIPVGGAATATPTPSPESSDDADDDEASPSPSPSPSNGDDQ